MANSYALTTASPGQNTVAVPFDYNSELHVKLEIDGDEVDDFVWNSASVLGLTDPLAGGERVYVYRVTPDDQPVVTYSPGTITASNLNDQNQQLLFIVQEAKDKSEASISVDFGENAWDAQGLRVFNAGTPVNPSDLVTKAYADTVITTGLSSISAAVIAGVGTIEVAADEAVATLTPLVATATGAATAASGSATAANAAKIDAEAAAEDTAADLAATTAAKDIAVEAAGDAELFADAAMLAGIVKDDTADGLANTDEGDMFSVISAEDDESFLLYQHQAGPTAVLVKTYPSSNLINNAFYFGIPEPGFVPYMVDDAGNVPYWGIDGLFDAPGFGPVLTAAIDERVRVAPERRQTSGNGLYGLRAKMARLKLGQSVALKVAVPGDSWAQRTLIPQALSDLLVSLGITLGSSGWISPDSSLGLINGLTLAYNEYWTLHDVQSETPAGSYGPDGFRLETTSALATVTVGGIKATTINIYSTNDNGVWRYRVNGGSWTTVTGTNTGAAVRTTISGLSSGGTHTLEIDTTGNSGTVKLHGAYATGLNGLEVSRMGNGGSTTVHMAYAVSSAVSVMALGDMDLDAAFIILGTNDYRFDVVPGTYEDNQEDIALAYLASSPSTGVILVAPPANNASGDYPMSEYSDACFNVADRNDRVEAYSLTNSWGDWATMNGLGVWIDDYHVNSSGARLIVGELADAFFSIK